MNTAPEPTLAEVSQTSKSRRVRILSDQVVNQIAAGEVVERPASVVKELVENSIDAGAALITVVIANGGRSSIEVIDDGCGMGREDAMLAVERFGTSKISRTEDLLSIATHGFRGEALPSIASVSRFHLSSMPREGTGTTGIEIAIEGGKLRDVSESALQPGTRIHIRDLFFNVPARRKFLRSVGTEEGLIRALIADFALAYPHVRFRLVADGSEVAHYVPGTDFFQRAQELKIAGNRPVRCEHVVQTAAGPVTVWAMLSEPIESLASSARLRVLINRRSVRDRLVLKAVRDGYGTFLRPGRYPSGVISLMLPPEDVDVNVHPQKTEVKFRRPDLVFGVVTQAISRAVRSRGAGETQSTNNATAVFPEIKRQSDGPILFSQTSGTPSYESQTDIFGEGSSPTVSTSGTMPIDLTRMRFVGQVMHCYLIMEGPEMIAMVDMHAAHERVKFFLIKSELLSGSVQSQLLLLPETVPLPPERIGEFEKFQPVLQRLGIEAELFGEGTIVIRSLPSLLHGISAARIINDLLAIPEWGDWGLAIDRRWDEAIARLACHRSIRSGRDLEKEEVFELLRALQDADASGYCPHGRPVVKVLRAGELEAMFGRVQ